MNWVRIACDIEDDPEVRALARALKLRVSEAVGMLVRVYARLPKHARTGDLRALDRLIVEDWCDWHGKAGAFSEQFFTRFTTDGVVKAWHKWNGKAIAEADKERERDRERKQRSRGAPPPEDQQPPTGTTPDAPRTSPPDSGRTPTPTPTPTPTGIPTGNPDGIRQDSAVRRDGTGRNCSSSVSSAVRTPSSSVSGEVGTPTSARGASAGAAAHARTAVVA